MNAKHALWGLMFASIALGLASVPVDSVGLAWTSFVGAAVSRLGLLAVD